MCKGSGWIEILGCGMVHPKVLSDCGIDPEVYSGFAFGIGLERITLLKYEIDDMRLLYENDARFLKQFQSVYYITCILLQGCWDILEVERIKNN